MVQPDAVVVELCSARTQILTVDEDELTKISDESGFKQLKKCVQQVITFYFRLFKHFS